MVMPCLELDRIKIIPTPANINKAEALAKKTDQAGMKLKRAVRFL
ncbi:hypothetical protein KUC_0021 [Vreelandella boliviensis LC1]|uniref:Uncharacterized protein n=1 Tax=Vreelandella boliviensis LC1 TaxID=1072583 RepID=A0A7U9GFL9_9GAMM|nr:hypothetical protein KUC_0021 [Halomonas boliviensis LC1]